MFSVIFATYNEKFEVLKNAPENYKKVPKCDCRPSCTDISYELELSQNIIKWEPINKLYLEDYDRE